MEIGQSSNMPFWNCAVHPELIILSHQNCSMADSFALSYLHYLILSSHRPRLLNYIMRRFHGRPTMSFVIMKELQAYPSCLLTSQSGCKTRSLFSGTRRAKLPKSDLGGVVMLSKERMADNTFVTAAFSGLSHRANLLLILMTKLFLKKL